MFKIHGSIGNPASIVATQQDYEKRYTELNEGLLGAQLKELLATKTIVFVGYSLRDSDFISLYELMKRRMGDLLPRAYVVEPNDIPDNSIGEEVQVIRTTGVRFLRELKMNMPEECFLPDERIMTIPSTRFALSKAHIELVSSGEMVEDPALLICACYQDGMLDAFDYISQNKYSGEFSHRCEILGIVEYYTHLMAEREEAGMWHTVAYIEGYLEGLTFLLLTDDEREKRPFYFLFGTDDPIRTLAEFQKLAPTFRENAPQAFALAKAIANSLEPGIVFHHRPEL